MYLCALLYIDRPARSGSILAALWWTPWPLTADGRAFVCGKLSDLFGGNYWICLWRSSRFVFGKFENLFVTHILICFWQFWQSSDFSAFEWEVDWFGFSLYLFLQHDDYTRIDAVQFIGHERNLFRSYFSLRSWTEGGAIQNVPNCPRSNGQSKSEHIYTIQNSEEMNSKVLKVKAQTLYICRRVVVFMTEYHRLFM